MRVNEESLWKVIYVAHGAKYAQIVRRMLEGEGFLVRLREIDRYIAAQDGLTEVLVLDSEAKEAREFLAEKGM